MSELSLFDVFQFLQDAVLVVDDTGKIQSSNAKASELLGYDSNELLNQNLDILIPENARQKHRDHLISFFSNHRTRKMGCGMEFPVCMKTGESIKVEIALAPIQAFGRVYTIAVVRQPASVEGTSTGGILRMREELEQFAFTVSHELKAPLARIKALAHLIAVELSDQDAEGISRMIRHLNDSVGLMEKLITGILNYSQEGNQEVPSMVNLNEVVQEVVCSINVPPKFVIEKTSSFPTIRTNRTKILQVFLNLISNAIKYNNKERGHLRIDCYENQNQLKFCFSDNGTSVSQEKRTEIFKLFGRVNKDNPESHGIGLFVIQKIIDQAGGEIWYEESDLGGSAFCFTWPISTYSTATFSL